MSAEIAKAIRRLLAVYGPPKTEEPEILFEEFEKALTGMRSDLLVKGVDAVIKDRAFSTWPTVGEVVQACRDASAAMSDSYAPEHRKFGPDWKREPVHPRIAKALLEGFTKTMNAKNAFADIQARANAWGRFHNCKVTITVNSDWGQEVVDEHGRIVPIGWKPGDAA